MGVVKADDVVVDISDCLSGVGVVSLPDSLHLQIQEEAFHHGAIPTVSLAADAGNQAVTIQQIPVGLAGVLTATVGMHNQAGRGLAQCDGHA